MVVIVEVCLADVDSAVAAQAGGAHRVELCDNLLEGGTTPSRGMILEVRRRLDIELEVMIRPRGGDFLYTEDEFAVMQRDIETACNCGADGIVLGLLDEEGRVDAPRLRELIELARPLEVTFHRAFDVSRNLEESAEVLIDLGVDRVLTSGGRSRAIEAADWLRGFIERVGGRLEVLLGGGIDSSNAAVLVERTGARQLHVGSGVRERLPSRMRFRRPGIALGGLEAEREFERHAVSAAKVRELVSSLPRS
jgi:copper homeostasis protein